MDNEKLDLPREEYEPVDLEFMGTEIILSVFDIKDNHVIKTCYGDVCKTVNALRDYSRMLTMVCDTWNLHGFHRATYEFQAAKLREFADKFQAGIGYDYDAAVERCEKQKAKNAVTTMWAARPWRRALSRPVRLWRPRPEKPPRRRTAKSLPRLKISQRLTLGQKIFDAI